MPVGCSRMEIAKQFLSDTEEQRILANYVAHCAWRESPRDVELAADCEQASWLALCNRTPLTIDGAKLIVRAAVKRESRSWRGSGKSQYLDNDVLEDDYSEESFA